MSTAAPSNRKWKIALVAALVTGPLLGALGTAWAVQTFPDVPPTHTFYQEIEWAAANGIVNGFDDGTFRPEDPVTRGESVAFLSQYNDAIHPVTTTVNPDASTVFDISSECPAGERAIGGDGSTGTVNLFVTGSVANGRSYTVQWRTDNSATIDPTQITVTALCAPDSVANPTTGGGAPASDKPLE